MKNHEERERERLVEEFVPEIEILIFCDPGINA